MVEVDLGGGDAGVGEEVGDGLEVGGARMAKFMGLWEGRVLKIGRVGVGVLSIGGMPTAVLPVESAQAIACVGGRSTLVWGFMRIWFVGEAGQGLPLAQDEADGGRKAFSTEAFLVGQAADELVVALFEVDHALDVAGGHAMLLSGGGRRAWSI